MISIIIPVLNEAENIEDVLERIAFASNEGTITEVIIVDGGSEDETAALALNFEGSIDVKVLSSNKGRAKQMNHGAQNAQGSILYFLHADTHPPKDFDKTLLNAIKEGNAAGCFRMRFDSNHPVLKFSQWFTQFNFRVCRGGDQSLFISKDLFHELNGFNEEYLVYEDCEFINRLYERQGFTVLNDSVITSARRYQTNGTLKLQYHFTVIHFKKWMGASPKSLFQYYQKNIAS